ncbi:MAG: hypothetical protein ACTHK9_05805 [Nitrobacter sp.]
MTLAFLSGDNEAILRQVCPAQPNSVAPPQAGVQQNLHCKPERSADRPASAKCGDIFLCPSAVPGGFQLHPLSHDDRIVSAHSSRHCVIHDGFEALAEIARRRRRVGHLVDQLVDVLRLEAGNRPIAMLVDKPIQYAAVDGLCRLRQSLEFGAAIVAPHCRSNRPCPDSAHRRYRLVAA